MDKKENNRLDLPESIYAFVEDVCRKQVQFKSTALPPTMLIPCDSGNGRSHITSIIANRYHDANICAFSSRDIFLDFTLKETVFSVYEADAEIQANAEYANDYAGVVAFNIDALISQLNNAAGCKFFELAAKVKKTAVLCIFLPADCSAKHIGMISEKIGAGSKIFPAIGYSKEELAGFFYKFIPKELKAHPMEEPFSSFLDISGFDKYRDRISAYIAHNIRDTTIKNIKRSAESLIFNDEAINEIFARPIKSREREVHL